MKNARQFALIAILITFAVNILVACDPKTRDGGSNTGAGGLPLPHAGGTSDSGGCNGVENRCFDSYIIDPTTLPAFKNIVEPLLKNVQSSRPEKPSSYRNVFKMKTWYLAPVDLEKLKKEALGVAFVKSEVQQIAIQNMKAIWIDKRIFDQMTEKDQADLLLHEMVMSLYFMRFVPIKELCEISKLINEGGKEHNCELPESIERAMPAEKSRPLNDEDNERIRFVTAWLLQNAKKPIYEVDFVRVMNFKGFDRRIFNPDNYGSEKDKPANLEMPGKQVLEAIKAAELADLLPQICRSFDGATSKSCELSFKATEIKFREFTLPAISLEIFSEGKVIGSAAGFLGQTANLTANRELNGELSYHLVLAEWKEKNRVGDRVSMAVLFFRYRGFGEQKQLVLSSAVIRKGVLTSIDAERSPICKTVTPKSKVAFDTGLIVHQDSKDELYMENVFSSVEPVPVCMKDNIE